MNTFFSLLGSDRNNLDEKQCQYPTLILGSKKRSNKSGSLHLLTTHHSIVTSDLSELYYQKRNSMNTQKSYIIVLMLFLFRNYPANSTLATDLYLDLMKKSLLNMIYQDDGNAAANSAPYDHKVRENGWDWPIKAHTMIGLKRLDNIQFCIKDILKNNVPGDVIETGVWREGATIPMRGILKVHGVTDRTV